MPRLVLSTVVHVETNMSGLRNTVTEIRRAMNDDAIYQVQLERKHSTTLN